MVWKKVNNSDPGSPDVFGGDDFDKLSDSLNGVNVGDPQIFNIDINTLKHSSINNSGDMLKNDGAKIVRQARGAANQYLGMNASGTDTEWKTPAWGFGDVTGAANVGTGTGELFRDETGGVLNVKRIAAGSNVTVTNNPNEVTISATGSGGGGADVLPLTYTFIIYKEGADFKAKNGLTGAVDFTNTNFRALLSAISAAHLSTSNARVRLFLKNGDYPFDTTSCILGSNTPATAVTQYLEIYGETRDGTILRNTNGPAAAATYFETIHARCNLKLQNLTCDGGSPITHGAGSYTGFLAVGAVGFNTTLEVKDCHIMRTMMGITAYIDTLWANIEGCWFEKTAFGDLAALACTELRDDSYIRVVNNYFNNQNYIVGEASALNASSLTFGTGKRFVIANNVFIQNAAGAAISVEHLNATPRISTYEDLLIANNHVFYGNIVVGGFDVAGAASRNVTVTGNNIRFGRITMSGPQTVSYTGQLMNIHITNNHITNAMYWPIRLLKVTGPTIIQGNTIRDSNFSGNASQYGLLEIGEAEKVLIANNNLYTTNTSTNVSTKMIALGTTTDCIVKDNYMLNLTGVPYYSNFGGHANNPIFKRNIGYTTENEGFTSVADGGTISHGLAGTPVVIIVVPSLANHTAAVTTKTSTTFTVALKIGDSGSTGTTQSVYWRASI